MHIQRYTDEKRSIWDGFLQTCKNATFLFYRDYMDYHRDRYADHSLIVCSDEGEILALLPANAKESTLISHGGLTFGGFLTNDRMGVTIMLAIFLAVCEYLQAYGFTSFVYKTIPHIYHNKPAEEDLYALFRIGAELYRRDITTTVLPALHSPFQNRRLRGVRKAAAAGAAVARSVAFDEFWPVLEQNLMTVHQVRPVHSVDEIIRLATAFPDNIKLYCTTLAGELLAGVVIYENPAVSHAQYIANSEKGRECGALDLLFDFLINAAFSDKRYFDFGTSTTGDGTFLDEGLAAFKEGFGGRAVAHDFYRINLLAADPTALMAGHSNA